MKRIVLWALSALLFAAIVTPAEAKDVRQKYVAPKVVMVPQEVCIGGPLPRTDAEIVKVLKQCPKDDDACFVNALKNRDAMRDWKVKQDARNAGRTETVAGLTGMGLEAIGKILNQYRADRAQEGALPNELEALDKVVQTSSSGAQELNKLLNIAERRIPVAPQSAEPK